MFSTWGGGGGGLELNFELLLWVCVCVCVCVWGGGGGLTEKISVFFFLKIFLENILNLTTMTVNRLRGANSSRQDPN